MKANDVLARTVSGIIATGPVRPGAVIRTLVEAVNAQRGQPVMLRLEPLLMFLMLLRHRAPKRRHGKSSLPAGCVLAVRYLAR